MELLGFWVGRGDDVFWKEFGLRKVMVFKEFNGRDMGWLSEVVRMNEVEDVGVVEEVDDWVDGEEMLGVKWVVMGVEDK